jgi:hypothetical protein
VDTVSMDTAFPAVLHIRIAKVLQFSVMNMQYCDTSILQYILGESVQKYPCVHAPPGRVKPFGRGVRAQWFDSRASLLCRQRILVSAISWLSRRDPSVDVLIKIFTRLSKPHQKRIKIPYIHRVLIFEYLI